jgi:EmrB/QacA subfamily drug resistance transporter
MAMPDATSPRWRALAVCVGALFMTLLDVSVTNVALPAIGDATRAAPAELQWVVSGYALAFGLVPIISGRLGDDHGRRRMFIIGVSGFVVTSALAGISPGPVLLIAARVMQGLAGGLINPQVSGLVQQMFTGADRGRAFGAIGTTVGVATAVGPLVGGGLIALGGPTLGWRLVFFVNVPVGIAIIVLARRWLPPPMTDGRRHRLDLPGAFLLGVATLCVLVAAVEYDALHDLRLIWLAVPAAALLAGFTRRELRLTRARQDPLVDLRLFARPSYSVGVGLALLYFASATGLPLVLALYYQRGLGYTALESGLGITAYALGSVIAAPLAGRAVTRLGRPLVVGGLIAFALGAAGIDLTVRLAPSGHTALWLAPALLLVGLGSGAVITPNQTLSLMDVDARMGSTAGGVLQTSQRIGSAVGQAVIGAAFFAALGSAGSSGRTVGAGAGSAATAAHHAAYARGLSQAVFVTLLFVGAALVFGLVDLTTRGSLRRRRLRGREAMPPGP